MDLTKRNFIDLPPCKNTMVELPDNHPLRLAVKKLALNGKTMTFYPELPEVEKIVFAIFWDGSCGIVKYTGAWTYKLVSGGYINKMPIAWCKATETSKFTEKQLEFVHQLKNLYQDR
jgi:hypothetical protein